VWSAISASTSASRADRQLRLQRLYEDIVAIDRGSGAPSHLAGGAPRRSSATPARRHRFDPAVLTASVDELGQADLETAVQQVASRSFRVDFC
jgi:hypothetical protein